MVWVVGVFTVFGYFFGRTYLFGIGSVLFVGGIGRVGSCLLVRGVGGKSAST